ncbi:MAG TPA: HEAT repeat domain-containing protein [Ktedonobacteraceae bacterium]
MTPEERSLIMSLAFVPGRDRKGSPSDVLQHFGATDGRILGDGLLRDAVMRQSAEDVEMALIVCFTFGIIADSLDVLVHLCSADWHSQHENVVSALDKLRQPAAVDALYHATQWIPEYLAYDEYRALATKAIWGLGNTPGPEAEQALMRLLNSNDKIVRKGAKAQLARRKKP